jgi:hypothetical protein
MRLETVQVLKLRVLSSDLKLGVMPDHHKGFPNIGGGER